MDAQANTARLAPVDGCAQNRRPTREETELPLRPVMHGELRGGVHKILAYNLSPDWFERVFVAPYTVAKATGVEAAMSHSAAVLCDRSSALRPP